MPSLEDLHSIREWTPKFQNLWADAILRASCQLLEDYTYYLVLQLEAYFSPTTPNCGERVVLIAHSVAPLSTGSTRVCARVCAQASQPQDPAHSAVHRSTSIFSRTRAVAACIAAIDSVVVTRILQHHTYAA